MPRKSRRDKIRTIMDTQDLIHTAIIQAVPRMPVTSRHKDPLEALPPGQMHAAMVLRRLQPCSLSILARMLHVSPASASLMVDRLVDRGVAERQRDTEDRRRVFVRLTPEVQAWIEEVGEALCDWFETLLKPMEKSLLNDWHRIMESLRPIIEAAVIKAE